MIDAADLERTLDRGLTATVEDAGRVTAVAVTARPDGKDCLVGKRTVEGRIVVWTPDRMVTMPGEYGCTTRVAFELPPGYVDGA